jgi:pimeloyl-ACP methyl ester carboxylesterase
MSPPPIEAGLLAYNNASLYYETAGGGRAVVFIHAGIADGRMWDKQFLVFAERYRVLRYDQRGYGRTTAQPATYSHLNDLEAVLHYLNVERAYLIGCSKGGRLALDYALAHPAHVAGLVMVNSGAPGYAGAGQKPAQWDQAVAAFEAGNLDLTNELEIQVWIDGAFRTPQQVDPLVRSLALDMNRIALANEMAGLGQEAPTPDAAGRLAEVPCPLLAIASDLDNPDFIGAAEYAAKFVPGGRAVTLRGAAHLPNMEQPEEFNRVVLDFLAYLDGQ